MLDEYLAQADKLWLELIEEFKSDPQGNIKTTQRISEHLMRAWIICLGSSDPNAVMQSLLAVSFNAVRMTGPKYMSRLEEIVRESESADTASRH